MGVTYKAFDASLDRHVALKVIAADERTRKPKGNGDARYFSGVDGAFREEGVS